jgi:hypothetical protein
LILRRALAVHRLFIPEDRPQEPRGVWVQGDHPIQAAIARSGHVLSKDRRGAYHCSKCGQKAGRRTFRGWLAAGPCAGRVLRAPDHIEAPGAAEGGNLGVVIGSQRTHHSHSLGWRRGVWFCTVCGGFGQAAEGVKAASKKLMAECPLAASRGGSDVLKRIRKGLPPRSGMSWPEGDDTGAPDRPAQEASVLWPDRRPGAKERKYRRASQVAPAAAEFEADLEDQDPWRPQLLAIAHPAVTAAALACAPAVVEAGRCPPARPGDGPAGFVSSGLEPSGSSP